MSAIDQAAEPVRMPDGTTIPAGAMQIGPRVYLHGSTIVVTGRVDPEDEGHDCDAAGCGWEHVVERVSVADVLAARDTARTQLAEVATDIELASTLGPLVEAVQAADAARIPPWPADAEKGLSDDQADALRALADAAVRLPGAGS